MLEAARALASLVVPGDDVRLAEKFIERGRFTAVHSVQLAERMLSPADASVDLARGSESTAARAGGAQDITVARRWAAGVRGLSRDFSERSMAIEFQNSTGNRPSS